MTTELIDIGVNLEPSTRAHRDRFRHPWKRARRAPTRPSEAFQPHRLPHTITRRAVFLCACAQFHWRAHALMECILTTLGRTYRPSRLLPVPSVHPSRCSTTPDRPPRFLLRPFRRAGWPAARLRDLAVQFCRAAYTAERPSSSPRRGSMPAPPRSTSRNTGLFYLCACAQFHWRAHALMECILTTLGRT